MFQRCNLANCIIGRKPAKIGKRQMRIDSKNPLPSRSSCLAKADFHFMFLAVVNQVER